MGRPEDRRKIWGMPKRTWLDISKEDLQAMGITGETMQIQDDCQGSCQVQTSQSNVNLHYYLQLFFLFSFLYCIFLLLVWRNIVVLFCFHIVHIKFMLVVIMYWGGCDYNRGHVPLLPVSPFSINCNCYLLFIALYWYIFCDANKSTVQVQVQVSPSNNIRNSEREQDTAATWVASVYSAAWHQIHFDCWGTHSAVIVLNNLYVSYLHVIAYGDIATTTNTTIAHPVWGDWIADVC